MTKGSIAPHFFYPFPPITSLLELDTTFKGPIMGKYQYYKTQAEISDQNLHQSVD